MQGPGSVVTAPSRVSLEAPRGSLRRGRIARWEVAASLQIATLGAWLSAPEGPWGPVAAAAAVATIVLAARSGRPARVAVSVLGLAASGAALHTTWQVNAIENRWEEVREDLIQRASQRLETTLGESVALVEALATRGAELATQRKTAAFALLEGGMAGRSPERGVVVFEADGAPWAWAGKVRIPPEPTGPNLRARITPFYVALEAQRRQGDRVAVAQLLLAADSSIPNRDATVAARFARATGSRLEFLRAADAEFESDVFDYCLPACDAPGALPDTLFSVRAVPPAQGTLKLAVLERGGRRVAVATMAALMVLVMVAGYRLRWVAVTGMAVLFVFTPLGSRLWLADVFSSRTYFLAMPPWFASSAGDLLVTAAFVLAFAGAVWPRVRAARRLRGPAWVGAAIVALAAPLAIRALAQGVSVPEDGVSAGVWIGWNVAVTLGATTVLLLAAALARIGWPGPAPRWTTWAGIGWAVAVAAIGVILWRPEGGFPTGFLLLWWPAVGLAIQPLGFRTVVASASVAGTAAALFTWGEVAEQRLVNAERDLQRFNQSDPLAHGLLEEFGNELRAQGPPSTAADLYARWRRTPLSQDNYPAVLAAWTADGDEVARLDLAELELPRRLLQAAALEASVFGAPEVVEYVLVPSVNYVLSVPFPDGTAVTAAVGPRSRAIVSVPVARYLRGERAASPPYEMYLSDIVTEAQTGALDWHREGPVVRGEQLLRGPVGVRTGHVHVPLGGFAYIVVRGALLATVSLAVATLVWGVGVVLGGRGASRPLDLGRHLRPQSFRARLTVALGLFFLLPTLVFAGWSVGRLGAEADSTNDIVIRRTLRDAANAALDFAFRVGAGTAERLDEVARQLNADLLLYEDGYLLQSSAPVLAELGLIDPHLPPAVFRQLVLDPGAEPETVVHRPVAGRETRVGYRVLNTVPGRSLVLGVPRLTGDVGFTDNQRDILYALLLATLGGFATAVALAAVAGRALAKPVHALSEAATRVGRGVDLHPFDPTMPAEFVPVVNAFERMARDVRSHQHAIEEALDFTAAVLRNVATGVIALGEDERVTTVNPRAIQLLGMKPSPYEPIAGQTGADWQPFWRWIRAFQESERESDAAEFTVGEIRIRAQVVAITAGERGCVIAMDDTTELAVAERILAWGDMARQVAHEIKNPLTPIRLGVQHLQRARRDGKTDFDVTLDTTSRQILAEIERLDAIARAFSRFGAPPAEAEPMGMVDLTEVANEAASLYGFTGGAEVVVHSANGGRGRVRKDELKEVLINLVENSRAAGADRIAIEVGADPNGSPRLFVRDNGKGIAQENLQRIFEPHFSTTSSGTGLGLAICKRLVESWGGSIRAESVEGEGTVFVLELSAGEPGRAPSPAGDRPPERGRRVP